VNLLLLHEERVADSKCDHHSFADGMVGSFCRGRCVHHIVHIDRNLAFRKLGNLSESHIFLRQTFAFVLGIIVRLAAFALQYISYRDSCVGGNSLAEL